MTIRELLLESSNISKAEVKRLDGFNKNAERVQAFLIGQIGKNFSISNNPIKLSDILEEVYSVFSQARELIGGRVVFLECENNDKLIELYSRHKFKLLNTEPQDDSGLLTMYINVRD